MLAEAATRKSPMEIPLPEPLVDVRDVLPAVGFVEAWDGITEQPPVYRYRRGGIDVHVAQVTGEYLRPEFLIGGVANNGRTLRSIEQSMPLRVESREQVLAWLSFAVGATFVPTATVPWFEEGKRLHDHLPWEQHLRRYREAREARPHAAVPREWMRLLRTSLRAAAEAAAPGDRYTMRFDGHILVFKLPVTSLAAPATGPRPWPTEIEGVLRNLVALPKRFAQDPVPLGIWKDCLEVENWNISLHARKADGAVGEGPEVD